MTNRRNGALYIGTTAEFARRVWEHREGIAEGSTRRYGLKRLVYAEEHNDILAAKQRELNIKALAAGLESSTDPPGQRELDT